MRPTPNSSSIVARQKKYVKRDAVNCANRLPSIGWLVLTRVAFALMNSEKKNEIFFHIIPANFPFFAHI